MGAIQTIVSGTKRFLFSLKLKFDFWWRYGIVFVTKMRKLFIQRLMKTPVTDVQ